MSKKSTESVVLKYSGQTPVNNTLKAIIPLSVTGTKIGFNHRYSAIVNTGAKITVPSGYKLCFRLVPALANRGMVATNAPGGFTEGNVFVHLLNCGREIVEVRDGDPLMELWVEEVVPFVWEEMK